MSIRRVVQIVTGLALVVGIAWFIKEPSYEPALTSLCLFATLIGLIYEEKVTSTRTVDKSLFEKFKSTLPSDGSIDFIDKNNMAGFSFERSRLNDLSNFFYDWGNAEHEFLNKTLENKRKILHEKIGAYLKIIGFETFPTHLPGRNTVPPEWEYEQPERFHKTVDKLHSLAGEIVDIHQDLIRTCKQKLKC